MIDPLSKKFMADVRRFSEDRNFWRFQRDVVERKVRDFFENHDPEILSEMLMDKLLRGAAEHGAPKYTRGEVQDNIEEEILDIVGWSLIGDFCAEKDH